MKKFLILILTITLCSCATGKYNYLFDTGKRVDFNQGKWLLNKTESNSKVFDNELYDVSHNEFKEILGSSLIDMNELRMDKLIAPKIGFELTSEELIQLGKDSECDFLINVKGSVVSNGAGTVSFSNGNGYQSASNQSSVAILIYNLKTGTIVSSSQAIGKVTSENSHFDNDNGIPSINSSAETLMLKAAKKLIGKYDQYRLDK